MKSDMREKLFLDWQALREACKVYHTTHRGHRGRAGGARHCVCGEGVGGSAACCMLGWIISFIREVKKEAPHSYHQDFLEIMKGIV